MISIFTRPGPYARPSHGIDVCVCVFVCLFVCLSPPVAWTFRYLLDTLDLEVLFGYLGPLGISWTFRCILDPRYLLDLLVPLGPLGTSWTFRCLLDL